MSNCIAAGNRRHNGSETYSTFSWTCLSKSPTLKTPVASPDDTASRASSFSPSSSIAFARAGPMIRGNSTELHASGVWPSAVNGVCSVVVSDTYTRSQSANNVTAMPTAGPCTAATIGFGYVRNASTKFSSSSAPASAICSNDMPSGLCVNIERSFPLENIVPLDLSSTALMLSCVLDVSSAFRMPSYISRLRAL